MCESITFTGLLLTLIGACLLFFYGFPYKKVGNRIIYGKMAIKFSGPNERHLHDAEWQPIANAFLKRAKLLNRTGFGLVAFGTLLQMVGLYF